MSLRALTTLFAALVLSACVSSAPTEPEPSALTLDAGGLQPTISGLRVDFGRAQLGVVDTVSRLLGDRPQITTNSNCSTGPLTIAQWRDGLTLNFQDNAFVGWSTTDPDLAVAGGFAAGQPRLEMPSVSFQVTPRGTEFNRAGVFGLLDENDTAVRVMWSGTTCFFR